MKNFGFSFIILCSRCWYFRFFLPHVYIIGKNHYTGKLHVMFVSQHKNYDCKCTHDYEKRCQVISEQVHAQCFSCWKSVSMEVFSIGHL